MAYLQSFIRKQKQRVGGRLSVVADRDRALISVLANTGECLVTLDLGPQELDTLLEKLVLARKGNKKAEGFVELAFPERGVELRQIEGWVEAQGAPTTAPKKP